MSTIRSSGHVVAGDWPRQRAARCHQQLSFIAPFAYPIRALDSIAAGTMAAVPPGVPPVVAAAAAVAQEAAHRQGALRPLACCGVDAVNTERCFCNIEGFCHPEDFALLSVDEVPKLAKRMAAQRGNVQMHVGAALQRHLEGLICWIRDLKRRDRAVNVAEITNQVLIQSVLDAEALRLSSCA
jgi:hypothetical protein